jgi:hypothetical protein
MEAINEREASTVNSSRLSYDENGLAYLNIKTKRKTAEGYEDNVRRVLFTGIAFTEGDDWRAQVTYKEGILDGEVVVTSAGTYGPDITNRLLLHKFRYEKGVKVMVEGLKTRLFAKSNDELQREVDRLKATLPSSVSASFEKAVTEVCAEFGRVTAEELRAKLGPRQLVSGKLLELYKEFDGLAVGQIIDKAKAIEERERRPKENRY